MSHDGQAPTPSGAASGTSPQPGDDLGLDRQPGTRHHRAYVGPPEDYDLIGGLTFSVLFACGLREGHRLLDVGCGSLRVGRLLLTYLRPQRYYGIEPNSWLLRRTVGRELGGDMITLKQPRFASNRSFSAEEFGVDFDFVLAQSILSHTYEDMTREALTGMRNALSPTGVLIATFVDGEYEQGSGWLYPYNVAYRWEQMDAQLRDVGLVGSLLEWPHPRQRWFAATLERSRLDEVLERVNQMPRPALG